MLLHNLENLLHCFTIFGSNSAAASAAAVRKEEPVIANAAARVRQRDRRVKRCTTKDVKTYLLCC